MDNIPMDGPTIPNGCGKYLCAYCRGEWTHVLGCTNKDCTAHHPHLGPWPIVYCANCDKPLGNEAIVYEWWEREASTLYNPADWYGIDIYCSPDCRHEARSEARAAAAFEEAAYGRD